MKAVRLISCFPACFLLAVAAACGSTDVNYTVKHSPGSSGPTQAPPPAFLPAFPW